MVVDNLSGLLVEKVSSLVSNISGRPLKKLYCLTATVAALLATCNLALATPKPRFSIPVVPWDC